VTVTLCTCLLLTPRAEAATAGAEPAFRFDIPATTLDRALPQFAEQCGVSVGMSGALPRVRTQAVTGRFTAQEALGILLAGTGLEAMRTGDATFRLQRVTQAAPARAATQELAEIVVTAMKRGHDLMTLPNSVAVISGNALADTASQGGSASVALLDVTTSSTNVGPGRDRQFIRGVADSAFLGSSQATVSVQFDEARATYSGPNPDLRLLDIDRVEVLKGPQGPLYGTGSLGGVYHIVPRRPDLWDFDFHVGMHGAGVSGGEVGGGADLVVNAPLRTGRLGLRAVAYAATEPGWIDNTDGRANANSTNVHGARVMLSGALAGSWSFDLQGIAQVMGTDDSQYVLGTGRSLDRSGVLQEPRDNDFYLGALTARGRVFGHDALVTVSRVQHEANAVLDASAAASQWSETAPMLFRDERRYHLWNHEARIWSNGEGRVDWLIGASRLLSTSTTGGVLEPYAAAARGVLSLSQGVNETALFGEVSMPLVGRLRVTPGLRLFRSSVENERDDGQGAQEAQTESVLKSATPSLALDWLSPDSHRFYYLRFARATRPGGLNPVDATTQTGFRSDKLSNLDLGYRLLDSDNALALQTVVFATAWQHVQSDFLLPKGLVGTRNVGDGSNYGLEVNLRWHVSPRWLVEAAGTVQHARLSDPLIPVGEDPRLPVVPDFRLHGAVARTFGWGSWQGTVRGAVDYIGASRLSFEQAFDRRTSGYAVLGGGIDLKRGGLDLGVRVSNLGDSRADTFSFGNPFSVGTFQQRTPIQPRTVVLSASWSLRP
jgi:iron complex outermembrane receptor protein